MLRLDRFAAGAGLAAALLCAPAPPASAEVSVRLGSGGIRAETGHYRKRHTRGTYRHGGRQQFGSGTQRGTRHRFESRPPVHGHPRRGHPHTGHRSRPHERYGGYAGRPGHSNTRRHDSWSRFPYSDIRGTTPKRRSRIGAGTLGSGCGPISQRYYDRYGRSQIIKRTLCHDRYGNPYVVGDGYR
jgi:hypothetical protein